MGAWKCLECLDGWRWQVEGVNPRQRVCSGAPVHCNTDQVACPQVHECCLPASFKWWFVVIHSLSEHVPAHTMWQMFICAFNNKAWGYFQQATSLTWPGNALRELPRTRWWRWKLGSGTPVWTRAQAFFASTKTPRKRMPRDSSRACVAWKAMHIARKTSPDVSIFSNWQSCHVS